MNIIYLRVITKWYDLHEAFISMDYTININCYNYCHQQGLRKDEVDKGRVIL